LPIRKKEDGKGGGVLEEVSILFTIPYINLHITEMTVMMWIIMGIIILWAFLATRNMQLVPKGVQASGEVFVDAINNFVKDSMPHKWKSYAPYIGTVVLFLGLMNTCGMFFLRLGEHTIIKPPTRNFAIPVAMAVMTILIVIGSGIKVKGIKGFIKSLFEPMWFLFPFNLLEFIIKPLSLSMRLFGNILGAFILMEMIINGLPLIFPAIASLYFDLFDGLLQAFIFMFLTTLYIAEEVEEE